MAVYTIARYPRTVELRDGTSVVLRPMTAGDTGALAQFFLRVPEDDRFFLKEDVTSPKVLQRWADELDYDRALPLLALKDGDVIADVVLLRHRGGSRSHMAEIRPVIAPEYRGKGLGVIMMRDLIEIACDAELNQVVFEFVKDVQDDAIEAAKFLGAFVVAEVPEMAVDMHGRPHDVVYLRLPLGKWWEWSQF
ncbi:MAG: hypothetical protein Kow0010_18410 [Dehalococcoidia bacterium]